MRVRNEKRRMTGKQADQSEMMRKDEVYEEGYCVQSLRMSKEEQ